MLKTSTAGQALTRRPGLNLNKYCKKDAALIHPLRLCLVQNQTEMDSLPPQRGDRKETGPKAKTELFYFNNTSSPRILSLLLLLFFSNSIKLLFRSLHMYVTHGATK